MRIKLLSDLHIEFGVDLNMLIPKEADADLVILAGDIHVGGDNTINVLKKFAEVYKDVVYVPGNHEYYRTSIEEFDKRLKQELAPCNHIHNLREVDFIEFNGIVIFGDTLWTNFRDNDLAKAMASGMISDFGLIKKFSPNKAVEEYNKAFEKIKLIYEDFPGSKKVIVTHFLPAIECTHPRFDKHGLLNYYFANDLGEWIKTLSNTIWCFGHTHDSMDFMLGDTRMLCNPKGYPNENRLFDNNRIFEV